MQSTVIKYTLLIAGAAVGAFVVALLGAYLMMPSVAPEAVGPAADSLTTSERDTTHETSMPNDTTATQPPPDSTSGPSPVVQRLRDSLEVVGRLQDSLRTLRGQLRSTEEEASTLRERVASLESRETRVDELKNALLGMGQRELATVLANVEMPVLKELYQRTAGRTRTQLLRAISAERTARFVNQVVGGGDVSSDTTATEDPDEEEEVGPAQFR